MDHSVRKYIIRKRWVVSLINMLYRAIGSKRFWKEVSQREKLPLFDYNSLVKPLPYSPYDIVIDNNFYGTAYWLKSYAGMQINKSLDATVEHGVFFGSLVRDDDKLYDVSKIVTFGEQRINHLKNGSINKEIVAIGPYIHYVESILSQKERDELKKELGRVLLVFPSHSLIGVDSSFCNSDFIKEIERIKVDYDTVLVSVYWTDVENKPQMIKDYQSMGYRVVTSGHRFDPNFLSRQRTIIELADYTISNKAGTHVGYCIYLNKPHYIYAQEVAYDAKNSAVKAHFDSLYNEEQYRTSLEEIADVTTYFADYSTEITQSQREIVNKYWGTSYIRTPKELKELLTK